MRKIALVTDHAPQVLAHREGLVSRHDRSGRMSAVCNPVHSRARARERHRHRRLEQLAAELLHLGESTRRASRRFGPPLSNTSTKANVPDAVGYLVAFAALVLREADPLDEDATAILKRASTLIADLSDRPVARAPVAGIHVRC